MAEENNIGASRLIGTNGLQQAVDALTTQVNKLTSSISQASAGFNNMAGSTGRASGGSRTGNNWNTGSNRSNYSSNGGGATFSRTGGFGGRGNGGSNLPFGMSAGGGSKFAFGVGAVTGVAAGLTAYGNRNMSSNMQMDMFGTYSATAGGFSQGARNLAMQQAFSNQYGALSAQDAAQAAYTNTFTFGNSQFNGNANPAFTRGAIQVGSFAYANPTLGAGAAATAAQQTYTARSLAMSQALGLAAPIGAGGVKNSMSNIAQSMMTQTFGNRAVNLKQFNAAISQGGSLATNMQYWGQQMGWNQNTIQEYQGILQGQVAAQAKGMSTAQYYKLLGQAQGGDKGAQKTLGTTTGMGTSMFENQRNLNATRLTRQEDILESLAPAFDKATQAVNNMSQALTNFLKQTGLGSAIGAGAGWTSALSGGLQGLSGGFGIGAGLLSASRLFRGAGGGLSGFFSRFGGGGTGGGTGPINASGGVYNITSLANGGSKLSRFAQTGGKVLGAAGEVFAARGIMGGAMSTLDKRMVSDARRKNDITDGLGPKIPIPAGWSDADILSYIHSGMKSNKFTDPSRSTNTDGRPGGGSAATQSGGSVVNGTSPNTGANAAQIIHFAESQLGVPYVWGGESPGKGMDCSGLTQWAYGQAGVSIPRTSQEQQTAGTSVALNNTQPGDLLFKGKPAHHVVMNIGGGKIIEAPHTGANVRIRSLNPSEFDTATRIVGSVGNINDLLNNNSSGNTNTLNNQQNTSGGNIGAYGGTSEAAALASALAGSVASMPMNSSSNSSGGVGGTATVGSTPQGNGQNDKSSLQAYAKQLLAKYGWGDQWNSFNALVMSESGWDVHAKNPSSGAYGIAQALPASKYSSAGSDWQSNGDTQLAWMMGYINDRYHSPNAAWSFHQKNNWYASGAWNIDQDQAAQVHKGEMILPAKQAETVRDAVAGMMTTGVNSQKGGMGGGLSIGNIHVHMPQGYSGTKQESQLAGKAIVDTIVSDTRLKNLQRGQ